MVGTSILGSSNSHWLLSLSSMLWEASLKKKTFRCEHVSIRLQESTTAASAASLIPCKVHIVRSSAGETPWRTKLRWCLWFWNSTNAHLPKLLYFLPRLPRVLFRSPVLTPRIANSHDGNKACPRYFSMVGPKPSDRKTFPPLKSLFWGYLVWQQDASLVPMFNTEDLPSSFLNRGLKFKVVG